MDEEVGDRGVISELKRFIMSQGSLGIESLVVTGKIGILVDILLSILHNTLQPLVLPNKLLVLHLQRFELVFALVAVVSSVYSVLNHSVLFPRCEFAQHDVLLHVDVEIVPHSE